MCSIRFSNLWIFGTIYILIHAVNEWYLFHAFYSKLHEELRKQSLLHAMDYANMDVDHLKVSVDGAKKKDKRMTQFVK